MAKYIARLKGKETEILTDREIAEYLHFFSREEIDNIIEIHYRGMICLKKQLKIF